MEEVAFDESPSSADACVQVLVIGAGAAGLCAALSARMDGAETLLLERDATPSGLTAMSQGAICAAGSRVQREACSETTCAPQTN